MWRSTTDIRWSVLIPRSFQLKRSVTGVAVTRVCITQFQLWFFVWSSVLLSHFSEMILMSVRSENHIPLSVCCFVCTSVTETVCLCVCVCFAGGWCGKPPVFLSVGLSVCGGPGASKYVRPSGHLPVYLDRWSTWGPIAWLSTGSTTWFNDRTPCHLFPVK